MGMCKVTVMERTGSSKGARSTGLGQGIEETEDHRLGICSATGSTPGVSQVL